MEMTKWGSDRHLHRTLPDEVSGYPFDPEHSWWSSIVPEASTNLIANPSFEFRDPLSEGADEYGADGEIDAVFFSEYPVVGPVFGKRAARILPGNGEGWLEYEAGVAVTPGPYTFSIFVNPLYTPLSVALSVINQAGSTVYARRAFTLRRGGWQRLVLTYVEGLTGLRNLRLTTSGPPIAGVEIYTDAWQFEAKGYATTYLDGDMVGFHDLQPNQSYFWHGAPHQSISSRRASTGSGGREVAWSQEAGFVTTSIVGLHGAPVDQKTRTLGNGRVLHRGAIYGPRDFTITGRIFGRTYAHLRARHRDLTRILRPNYTVDNDEMILRHQVINANGDPVGPPLDIVCFYRDGMQGNVVTLYQENLPLQFQATQPFPMETVERAVQLTPYKSLVNNTLVYRDEDGEYHNLGEGLTLGGVVARVGFLRDGRIVAAGNYTELGGDEVEGVSLWDGSNWVETTGGDTGITDIDDGYRLGYPLTVGTLGGQIEVYSEADDAWTLLGEFDGPVRAIQRDSAGDIWVAGEFEFDEAATAIYNNVARYNAATEEWEALGTGLTDPEDLTPGAVGVYAVLAPNDGYIYFGGSFEQGDTPGVTASANAVVRWNVAEEQWEQMGSGLDGTVRGLLQGQDGFIYAVGEFDSDGFQDYDIRGFARWNGYLWEEVFPVQRVDGSYGADGFVQDEEGIIWFYNYFVDENDLFVVPGLGNVGFFGWRNGIIYPPYIQDAAIRHLAIGPGNRVVQVIGKTAGATEDPLLVPALNRVINPGSAETGVLLHLQGSGNFQHALNHSTRGGLYTPAGLLLSSNEHMVVRTDRQTPLIYSNQRPNLFPKILSGPTSLSALRLLPGENRISFYMTGLDDDMSDAWLNWRTRYWGLEEALR